MANPHAEGPDAPLSRRGWARGGLDGTPGLSCSAADLDRFAAHWNDLELDQHMRDGGTYRYRRYGHFSYRDGHLTQLAHASYYQTSEVNPLNGGIQRDFAPLTAEFIDDPVVQAVVETVGRVVSECGGSVEWDVKLHPFRIITSADHPGSPTPQGRHRDGCDYVTTVLVSRTNITGGETSLYDDEGRLLLQETLADPGAYLTIDDRVVQHEVTDIHVSDAALPAYRDVLIVDFDRPGTQGL